MANNHTVAICIPCMDTVPTSFMTSLVRLNKPCRCVLCVEASSLIYTARNNLVNRAVQNDCDLMLWLDSDMVFEPDTLERLLQRIDEGEDFVAGLYVRRSAPYSPVAFRQLEVDEAGKVSMAPLESYPANTPFEAAGVGFGCVLMRTAVAMNVCIEHKWMFDPMPGLGEDLSFCWRARKCGVRITVDPTIPLGHEGKQVFTQQFYRAYSSTQK